MRREALKRLLCMDIGERTWRVSDAEVEERMKQWAKARAMHVVRGEELEDKVSQGAMELFDECVSADSGVNMRQAR